MSEVVQPGQVVGGYVIEKKLGAGGFGHVYLARREGVPHALKFIHPATVGDWGWRELYILQRHEFPHVVRLLGHFKWPADRPEYLVLVMEYVPGPTLYAWARRTNPSARQLLRLLLPLGHALRHVHAQGVLHRDLKGDNILVREPEGTPVLVDFGAGSMHGVPRATRDALAPANVRYRSPESIAFFLRPGRRPGERHPYSGADELYALGVLLYVLLTDQYPFAGPEEELLVDVLQRAPTPPSVRNPRVPTALDALCARLLAKAPADRLPDTSALCARLEALLAAAEGDPRWDLPLCYGWTEEGRTTEDVSGLVAPDPAPAWMRRRLRQKPRRGSRPAPLLAPSRVSALRTVGLLLGLLGVTQLRPAPVREPDPVSLGEMAPRGAPREAAPGAAPPRADTPAPATAVAIRSDVPRMKKKSSALLLGAAATQLACASAPVRSTPTPPPCPASAVKRMTEQLGLPIGTHLGSYAEVSGYVPGGPSNVPVRQGPFTFVLKGDWDIPPYPAQGRTVLPNGTRLVGRLSFDDKQVQGYVTQAITPDEDTFSVCLQLNDVYHHTRGVDIESRRGQSALIYRIVELQAVDRFE